VLAALNPGETPVITQTTTAELRGLATAGRMHMPGYARELPVINDVMDVNTRINIRGMLADIKPGQRGLFGDGSIGATALNRGLPVITSDKAFTTVLKSLGVEVRAP
jgi:predicted nucleic acid-binding protein